MHLFGRILPSLALAVCAPVVLAQAPSRSVPPTPVSRSSDVQPPDATARCRDGSFTTDAGAGRCASNGGVLVSFPARVTPPAPIRPSIAAPSNSALTGASASPTAPPSSAPPVLPKADPVNPSRAPASPVAPPKASRGAAPIAVESREIPRPAGATARCKDGTFTTGPISAGICGGNGGVAVLFPAERRPLPVAAPMSQQRTP